MEGTSGITRLGGVFFTASVDRARRAMLAIRPRRGDNVGEVRVARDLSAALSPPTHTAQHLYPLGTGRIKEWSIKLKTFGTPPSELSVSKLAFDIEPRGAIPGIASENRKRQADGDVRRLRPGQLVAIGEEGKLGKELGKDRSMERTIAME